MSTINNNKAKFTIEDFEKGLMLLGLVSPLNESETNQVAEILAAEKMDAKNRQQLHFKRVVLAAEIISNLYKEPTFGKIKFQKLVYLCEYAADMQLEHRYLKQAAGPFDNKFMHSIHKELKKLKWFDVETLNDGNITRSRYYPLENSNDYQGYFESYYGELRANIKTVIDLFKTAKTHDVELAATVLACYLELKKSAKLTKDNLIHLFYNWSERKSRFTEAMILDSFNWLHVNNFIQESSL